MRVLVCAGCNRQWSSGGAELTPNRRRQLAKRHEREQKQLRHARRQLVAAARRIEEYGLPDDGTALERPGAYPVVRHRKQREASVTVPPPRPSRQHAAKSKNGIAPDGGQ